MALTQVATAEYDAYQVYSSPAQSFNYSVVTQGWSLELQVLEA